MTKYSQTLKLLTTVSAITLTALSISPSAQAQSAFTWGQASETAKNDRALSEAQIQIKYDGINAIPQLNVSANTGDVVVSRQDSVSFQTYWNYGAFIARGSPDILD